MTPPTNPIGPPTPITTKAAGEGTESVSPPTTNAEAPTPTQQTPVPGSGQPVSPGRTPATVPPCVSVSGATAAN